MHYTLPDIEQYLQQEAENSQTSWEYITKLYALEGLVRRASMHPKAAEIIIRGSLITRAWVLPHYRPVDDVDFLADYPFDTTRGVGFIREMLRYDLDDFLTYDTENLEIVPTWVETPLPGERIFVKAKGLGQNFTLQIDLAYNDPLVPPAIVWEYPTLIPAWKTPIHTIVLMFSMSYYKNVPNFV